MPGGLIPMEQLHPRLGRGGGAGLRVYCRSRTGLLADDGQRWAVLVLPGGGYRCLAPAEAEPVALGFLAAGVQAFVLEYSTLPTPWPRPLLEGAAAMAWLRGRAEEYGFRPDRVAVCGFSAGGHLAGSLCALWDHPLVTEALGLEGTAARPDRAILGYPVVHDARYLAPLGEGLELDRLARRDHPPAFLWTTGEDATVPPENTLSLAAALRAKRVPCELHLFARGPHAMGLADRESARDEAHRDAQAAAWLPLCLGWLKGED